MSEQNKALYIEPIGKSIIVERSELTKDIPIFIMEPMATELTRAKVIALGPDVEITISVGDTVYYDSSKGTIINTVDPPQIILQPEDIIAREEQANAK